MVRISKRINESVDRKLNSEEAEESLRMYENMLDWMSIYSGT